MKFFFNTFFTVMLLVTSCKKDPKDVVLSVDKTSVEKGKFITLTVQWDGKAKWINFYIKTPGSSSFTDNENRNFAGNTQFKLDSLGVYTFYAIAYSCANKSDYNKLKECRGQTKSNEVNVNVIVPCSECDSSYRYNFLKYYFFKLVELTDSFQIEATQILVDSSKVHAKGVADALTCLNNFNYSPLINYDLTKYLIRTQWDTTLTQKERDDYVAFNAYCDFFPIAYPGKINIMNCP